MIPALFPLLVPQTLKERMCSTQIGLIARDGLLAFPYHWQVPAATEKAAYESILDLQPRPLFDYVAFPWATIIDGLKGNSVITPQILMALKCACEIPAGACRRVTVAQHIHAMQFVEMFKACGITDLFWSHATHQQTEIEGIRLHPFPIFPAQTPECVPVGDLYRPRLYLANFIGAYNPKIYLTNVREVIYNDPNDAGDLLIVKRESWHFDRVVYEEQIKGKSADNQKLLEDQRHAEEYINAIKDSWFTLCPSGSGPNSIRIFESLCLGSIPIVLTRNLRLAGSEELWKKAAIIEEDSVDGYSCALEAARRLNQEQRIEKLKAGRELFQMLSPREYGRFIVASIE